MELCIFVDSRLPFTDDMDCVITVDICLECVASYNAILFCRDSAWQSVCVTACVIRKYIFTYFLYDLTLRVELFVDVFLTRTMECVWINTAVPLMVRMNYFCL